jgi:hypothetical protein
MEGLAERRSLAEPMRAAGEKQADMVDLVALENLISLARAYIERHSFQQPLHSECSKWWQVIMN